MELLHVHFRAELNHVAECHSLFSVSDEKSFCHKRRILIEDLWLQKTMKVGPLIISLQITPTLEMIRIRVVHLLLVLVEDLEFEEVDALLEKVNVAEVLNVKHKFGPCPVHTGLLLTKMQSTRLKKY